MQMEYRCKLGPSFGEKMPDDLKTLGGGVFKMRRNPPKSSGLKKTKTTGPLDKELLSRQVRIPAPILPDSDILAAEKELLDYASTLFSDLFATFGKPATDSKTRKNLRRQDSHVSADNTVYTKNQRREEYIKFIKELCDVVAEETTLSEIINQSISFESTYFTVPVTEAGAKALDVDVLFCRVEELDSKISVL